MPFIVFCGWIMFMSVGVFGGGQTFIPFLENIFVDTGMISVDYFYEIIGLANAFPGPFSNKLYVLFTYQEYGLWATLLISILFATPGIVVVMFAAKGFQKLKKFKPFTNITLYINATVAGLLGYIGYSISESYIFRTNETIIIGMLMVALNLFLFKLVKNLKVIVIIINMIVAVVIL